MGSKQSITLFKDLRGSEDYELGKNETRLSWKVY